MRKKNAMAALSVLCVFSLSFSETHSSNVTVGVMEDDRLELVNWQEGPSKNRVILPLFEKRGDEWVLSPNHPEEMQWAIAFNGGNAGIIRSRPKASTTRSYPGDTHIHIPEPQSGPEMILGEPSIDFSGWMDTNVNRPLVLVSNGNVTDPDEWKTFQPADEQIKLFKSEFRAEFSEVTNCDETEMPLPDPWQYKDDDIRITRSYQSGNGDSLVGMYLEGGKCGMNDAPFTERLFLFKPDKSTVQIVLKSERPLPDDMNALSLIPVDAGDYDADGESEAVFFISGYNEDGYALFYDSFQKSVMWTWNYH